MGKFSILLILFLSLSCGIPEYININTPVKNEALSINGTKCVVNIEASAETTKFSIYGRYYDADTTQAPNKQIIPDDLELKDVPGGSEKYLTDRGFQLLEIESDNTLYNTISIDSNITLTISNPPFILDINGIQYPLKYEYKISGQDKKHYVGTYSDEEGQNFINQFENDNPSVTIDTIQIQFAVIAKGLDPATVTNIESVPVPIGYLDLATQG